MDTTQEQIRRFHDAKISKIIYMQWCNTIPKAKQILTHEPVHTAMRVDSILIVKNGDGPADYLHLNIDKIPLNFFASGRTNAENIEHCLFISSNYCVSRFYLLFSDMDVLFFYKEC
jgi:hypothetical protein